MNPALRVFWFWQRTQQTQLKRDFLFVLMNPENWTSKLEPWTLRKNHRSEIRDCFSKCEYFEKPRITVIGSSLCQVSVITLMKKLTDV